MVLATDLVGMALFLDKNLAHSVGQADGWGTSDDPTGFTVCYKTMTQAQHGEIGLSDLVLSQGYEMDCMLTAVAAETPGQYCNKTQPPGDILFNDRYFGFNVHPYELAFVKNNRDINPIMIDNFTNWHMKRNTSSWDTCGW
jgi:hypothetical protein